MKDVNVILKERRTELKLTMLDVAKMVGVSEGTISRWESGDIANMRRDKIAALAKALQISPGVIMGWNDEPAAGSVLDAVPTVTSNFTTFPVIGEIAAGYDSISAEDWSGETIDIPNSYLKGRALTDFFVLEVKGDSMFPEYRDGDKVLILKQSTLNYSGQVGAILYDDNYATLKRVEYAQGEDWLRLVPINPSFPSQRIEGENLEHCRVIGIPRLLVREIAG